MMPSILQSALHPAGPGAASISVLWWLMFWTCAVVYVLTMGALWLAVRRRGARRAPPDRTLVRSVIAATAVTGVILFGLLFASVVTGRAIGSMATAEALVIEITGNQWWWDVEYLHPEPALRMRTANELHLPVGRRVRIQLKSNDVIHSFWVPNLQGKMDLIPGRQTVLWLQADTPGVYRGQCAEYCGLQHAHMAFSVVAESSEAFERWLGGQRRTAPSSESLPQQRGRDIIERGPCALCHTVRGTEAGGRTAPDLTHFATRSTIAAGSAPNTREHLARWIADPQQLKPGAKMPALGLSGDQLEAVLAYMELLK
jgi:cytochrome c oxidase subunit 2